MTTTTTVYFTEHQLTAAAAADDEGRREFFGPVVPFNVPGNTSAGRLRFRPGSLRLPADLTRVKLVYGHDKPPRPIAYAHAADEQPTELVMRFTAGTIPLAQQAYVECKEHLRDGFSVELGDLTVRNGWVEDAELVQVALLPDPAFTTARALVASDHPDQGGQPADDPDQLTLTDPPPSDNRAPASQNADDQAATAQPTGDTSMTAPTLTAAAAPVGARPGATLTTEAPDPQAFFQALVARHTGQRMTPELEAALADVTYTANQFVASTQFEGELWSGVSYRRRFVPLIANRRLTSYKVQGWRWVTKPAVAAWAGNKTAVPSNAAVTEAVNVEASRLAGAHDVDRKFRDFGDTAFFESYYRAMTESYALLSDQAVVSALLAAATVTAGGPLTTLAAGLTAAILDMPDDAIPSFAIVGKDLLSDALAVTTQNAPAYLPLRIVLTGATGPEVSLDGSFPVYPSSIANGTVLVAAREAMTYYELGEAPIRVEAVDMVKGGVDPGVFGYYATITNDATAIRKIAVTP